METKIYNALILFINIGYIAFAVASSYPAPYGTIAFHSVGTTDFAFDIFEMELDEELSPKSTQRIRTDSLSRNYNPSYGKDNTLVFVSERDGNLELYSWSKTDDKPLRLTTHHALDDKPTLSPNGSLIAFVSTREPSGIPLLSWNAIYITNLEKEDDTVRLTPKGFADFSPTWSPNGEWIAFAQYQNEYCKSFDIGVMRPNGKERTIIAQNGGWPTWSADSDSIFFHSFRNDHWGIYRIRFDTKNPGPTEAHLVSPEDVDVMTPTAGIHPSYIIVAARKWNQPWRQIYKLNIQSRTLHQLTSTETHHYSPALSRDGQTLSFHRCNGESVVPNIERLASIPSAPELSISRSFGAFPTFSPDGKQIAAATGGFKRIDVFDYDGANRHTIYEEPSSAVFALSWSRHGRVSASRGPIFHPADTSVDVIMMDENGGNLDIISSEQQGNKAFASFAPSGDRVVFRSGSSGYKNLYTMSADGNNVKQLTKGPWTDTMPNWSPNGEWIAFSRERNANFSIWMIRPNGSDEHQVFADHGRCNHVWFSPDSKWVVFTSDFAGCSVEAISVPFQYQPYGEIFIMRVDGTELQRLTHNGYEDGTPSWGKLTLSHPSTEGVLVDCAFSDVSVGDYKQKEQCPFATKLYGQDGRLSSGTSGVVSLMMAAVCFCGIMKSILYVKSYRSRAPYSTIE